MAVSQLHVISGLPRSGSTLLSAILCQNPKFNAAVTSPVSILCTTLHRQMSEGNEFRTFFNEERRRNILRSVFDGYYSHISASSVIFDTNRNWTGKAALIGELYPECRIICCVRDIGWIINSIESMLVKNPLYLSRIFNFQPTSSVYSRAEILMNSETGLIGQAWSNLRECWFGKNAKKMIVIQYDTLVSEPERVMRGLYEQLAESYYPHDFQNLSYDEPEYDADLGMPGMHRVHQSVKPQNQTICIPPDLFAKYKDASFWLKAELNIGGAKIL